MRTTSATEIKTPARLLFGSGSNVADAARKFGDAAGRAIGTALPQDAWSGGAGVDAIVTLWCLRSPVFSLLPGA